MEADVRPRPSVSLFFLVAQNAPTAVVLRRGPSRQVEMLRWDLETDVVVPGQWLRGRVYDEKCDLSPDGRLFVYFAGRFSRRIDTYTAVCRPPWFTALAFWPSSGTIGGGGRFADDHTLVINSFGMRPDSSPDSAPPPDRFSVVPALDFAARNPDAASALVSRGWITTGHTLGSSDPARDRRAKRHPIDPQLLLEREALAPDHRVIHVGADRAGSQTISPRTIDEIGRCDRADWDHDGSLLLARDGLLLRRLPRRGEPAWDPPQEIANLRDRRFTRVRPPDRARSWP